MRKLLCLLLVLLSVVSFSFGCGTLKEHEAEFVDLYVAYASEEALYSEIESIAIYEDKDDGMVAYIKCVTEMEETKYYYFVMETIKTGSGSVKYGYFQEKNSDFDVLLFGDGEQGTIKDWMAKVAKKTTKEYNVKDINKAIKETI